MKKVFINGTFDILHAGHVKLFRNALDYFFPEISELVVAIDSDKRIKELKGFNRPIHNLYDRIAVLNSIKYIYDIRVFDSDKDLLEIIKSYQPDLMVKGSDYRDKLIIGAEYCKEILFVERTHDSTTKIIERISNR